MQDDVTYRLSKWDPNNKEKYLGDDEYWETTQDAIRNILVDQGVPFVEAEEKLHSTDQRLIFRLECIR